MPTVKELFSRPLSRPALWLFCFGYGMAVIHILLSVALWLYVPFFTAFFETHFIDATTTLLFSLNLTLAMTLLLDYHIQTQSKEQKK